MQCADHQRHEKHNKKGENMKDKFLYNKKRKHYSYIFKVKKGYCLNILLTTDAESKQKKHKKEKIIRNSKKNS